MNIVKLQNELKGVPDNALIGYVQNPTGQVPSYLALSELQRRKEMRTKYQQQQTPEKSVAEDLTQSPDQSGLAMLAKNPTPQGAPMSQGVADLPISDSMYKEDSFAAGGIVAFDDGGKVEHFDQGGTSRLGRWWEGYKQRSQADLALQDEIQRLQNEYLSLTIDPLKKTMPGQPEAAARRQAEIKQRIAELSSKTAPVSNAPTATTGGPRVDTTQLPKSFTGIDTPSQFGPSANIMDSMSTRTSSSATSPRSPDLGGLYQPLPDYSKEYANLYQDPAGAAERDMARYKAMVGEDPMRPELEKKLKQMEERSAKAEEQAPWMALARAGFGMAAGKSPFALQNIAEGAAMGLEDYAKARDKLETAREKQFDLQARLAQSQRAEQVAAATYGLNSEQHIKAQNQANKLAELSYKYTRDAANQKNKIDAFEAVNKGKYYEASAEESRAKAGYYGEKGPSGEITEKALFDKYISSGGEFVNGPWEEFKRKFAPKPMPKDVDNLLTKYLK